MSKTRLMLGGVKSFLPVRTPYTMSSQPVNARYGYSVWLRHLAMLEAHGIRGPFRSVVEMGPGNSVATGVASVLSGATSYIGLDVLHHLAHDQALRILAEVEALFTGQAAIPAAGDFPNLEPTPPSFEFPAAALRAFRGDEQLGEPDRSALRRDIASIAAGGFGGETVSYRAPWSPTMIPDGSADLIFSQAVLEEIPNQQSNSDLAATFATLHRWLRPGGVSCHQIDLGMYGLAPWNIHWTWGPLTWAVIRGRRDNFVNREPLSTYLRLAEQAGFEVVATTVRAATGVEEDRLHPQFRALPERDRTARAAHVILRRT